MPERVLGARVMIDELPLELHVAHLPPGVTRGLVKVESFEAIYGLAAHPSLVFRILCGTSTRPRPRASRGT